MRHLPPTVQNSLSLQSITSSALAVGCTWVVSSYTPDFVATILKVAAIAICAFTVLFFFNALGKEEATRRQAAAKTCAMGVFLYSQAQQICISSPSKVPKGNLEQAIEWSLKQGADTLKGAIKFVGGSGQKTLVGSVVGGGAALLTGSSSVGMAGAGLAALASGSFSSKF